VKLRIPPGRIHCGDAADLPAPIRRLATSSKPFSRRKKTFCFQHATLIRHEL